VPVDPRSDLPIRIAKTLSETLGVRINPSQLYSIDGGPLGVWHSSRRYDYDHEEDDQHLFHNRRVTCFNLLLDPTRELSGTIPLQVKFNDDHNMSVFARCAIHEVYESRKHNLEGQSNPAFDPNEVGFKRKIGLEITLDALSPIRPRTHTNGNYSVFLESAGQSVKFEQGVMRYDPLQHGTELVVYATDTLSGGFKPEALEPAFK